jgi:hypothetical protein
VSATSTHARPVARTPCPTRARAERSSSEMSQMRKNELEMLAREVDDQYAALVLLAGYVGLHWGELAGLRRQRLRLSNGRSMSSTLIEIDGGRLESGPQDGQPNGDDPQLRGGNPPEHMTVSRVRATSSRPRVRRRAWEQEPRRFRWAQPSTFLPKSGKPPETTPFAASSLALATCSWVVELVPRSSRSPKGERPRVRPWTIARWGPSPSSSPTSRGRRGFYGISAPSVTGRCLTSTAGSCAGR